MREGEAVNAEIIETQTITKTTFVTESRDIEPRAISVQELWETDCFHPWMSRNCGYNVTIVGGPDCAVGPVIIDALRIDGVEYRVGWVKWTQYDFGTVRTLLYFRERGRYAAA